jgi:hypothetical protein
MDDFLAKKRPVPVLTRDNWEQWFSLLEAYLRSKSQFYTVTQTLEQYAWIARLSDGGSKPKPKLEAVSKSTANTPTSEASIEDLQSSFQKLGGTWNQDKREKYEADAAGVLYTVTICIDQFDKDHIDEFKTVQEKWNALRAKYSATLPAINRENLQKLTSFVLEDGVSIENAWTRLHELRRRIVAQDASLKAVFDEKRLFQYLLASLPVEYTVTRDTLDAQPNLSLQERLAMLQAKEHRIATEAAMAARDTRGRSQGRKPRRQSHSKSRSPVQNCFLCGGDHFARTCPVRDEFQSFLKWRKLQKGPIQEPTRPRNLRKSTSSPRLGQSKPRDYRNTKAGLSNRHHGYAAVDDLTSNDALAKDSPDSESDDEPTEHAAVSNRGKIPSSDWVADSGASSHMTDQPLLFRGPLIPIKRRTIRVGGGVLYASQKGTVELQTQRGCGSVLLANVLLVPRLGVNLLSTRKICRHGLTGTFDDKKMYFNLRNKTIMEAKQCDGLYVISKVARGYEETAFLAKRANRERRSISPVTRGKSPGASCDHYQESSSAEGKAQSKVELERYKLFHRRFAHLRPEVIKNLHRVTTLKERVHIPEKREICEVCALTKLRNQTSKVLSPWKDSVLELVSLDIAGPFPESLRGNRYFAQVIDNATRKTWTIPGKTKSDIATKLDTWKLIVEAEAQAPLRAARSDNAAELVELLQGWRKKGGSKVEFTTTYKSSQNGIAERSIQTAEADARAMLKDAGLPIEFWDEAVEADAHVRNRTGTGPFVGSRRISPEQAWSGQVPSIDHVRVWGSKCYAYVHPKSQPKGGRKDKLLDRGRVAIMMGYGDETDKQYKVYAPDLGRTIVASVVKFDEDTSGGTVDLQIRMANVGAQGTPNELPTRKPRGRPEVLLPDISSSIPKGLNNFEIAVPSKSKPIAPSSVAPTAPPIPLEPTDVERPVSPRPTTPLPAPPPAPAPPAPTVLETPKPTAMAMPKTSPAQVPVPLPEPVLAPPPPRYFTRKRQQSEVDQRDEPPRKILKEILALITEEEPEEAAYTAATLIPIPKSYTAAINDPIYGDRWLAATVEEITSLNRNSTFREEIAPKGANLISAKWVFTVKSALDGSVERFKARLVARGFSQVLGEDYFETFAPTVRADTLRTFLALVAAEDLECSHFDIKNAFTESSLKERIYLLPPPGVPVRDGYVLRVLRSLYGLKQSARDWNRLCRDHLLQSGFTQSLADPCLFVCPKKSLMLLVYVDDIVAASPSRQNVQWLYQTLSSRFNTKDLGEISKVLGIRVTRNRKTRELFLDQEQYLEGILTRFGITHGKYKGTATPITGYDNLRPSQSTDKRIDSTEYRHLVGSVMYGMVYTRPDIAFLVGRLGQYMADPAEHHGHAMKGLLRYLRSTVAQKLRFGPSSHKNLVMYSDADWASDRNDRKSISGNVALLNGGPIMWRSTKQTSVATSSTESEYIAMSQCGKSSQWVAQVIRDMGYPQYIGKDPKTVDIRGDNQGALALVKNPHLHERSKHIDICHHFIRDLAEKARISVTYIPTGDMAADGLTKPLARVAFERFKGMLGLAKQ